PGVAHPRGRRGLLRRAACAAPGPERHGQRPDPGVHAEVPAPPIRHPARAVRQSRDERRLPQAAHPEQEGHPTKGQSMTDFTGRVAAVNTLPLGSTLAEAAASGATTLVLEDT